MMSYIPGSDIIGKGYDVFGRYAHPSAIKNGVIFSDFNQHSDDGNELEPYEVEISSNTYEVPSLLSVVEEHISEESYVQGSSISKFQEELDVKVSIEGQYKYYSGEADFGFHMSRREVDKYYYTRFSALMRSYRLALTSDLETLKGKLNDDFKQMLNAAKSKDQIDALFKNYGTHFLLEVVMGGKNSYFATVEKSSVAESIEVEAAVKASYNSIFASGSVSVDTSYSQDSSQVSVHSETGIETIGGNETLAPLMLTDQTRYEDWLNTVNQDPALIDFTQNSLYPIWELCDDDTAYEEIKNRFYEISGEQSSNLMYGTATHGDAVYVPWGNKEDWNLFLTPASIGRTEGADDQDADNAILSFQYDVDPNYDYPDHWQVIAKYRYRTNDSDKNDIKWYEDGLVNYILIPKYDPHSQNNDGAPKEVSVISNHKTYVYQGQLTVPFTPPNAVAKNREDWYYLINPYELDYEEENLNDNTNNALLGWEWNFNQEDTDFVTIKFRKGSGDDMLTSIVPNFKILWVHKDYGYWTGARGNQRLRLPLEENTTVDDWALIASPICMGNIDGTTNQLLVRSLLQTSCSMSIEEDTWTVSGSYRWVEEKNDASSIKEDEGQVECLFIRTSVYEQSARDMEETRTVER